MRFFSLFILDFFIAFGIVLGGAMLGGLGALLLKMPPLDTIKDIAEKIKFWAVIGAIGGTFEALKGVEEGFFGGHLSVAVKHFLFLLSAFAGALSATSILRILVEGKGSP